MGLYIKVVERTGQSLKSLFPLISYGREPVAGGRRSLPLVTRELKPIPNALHNPSYMKMYVPRVYPVQGAKTLSRSRSWSQRDPQYTSGKPAELFYNVVRSNGRHSGGAKRTAISSGIRSESMREESQTLLCA